MIKALTFFLALIFSIILTSCANKNKHQQQQDSELTYKKAIFVVCEGDAKKEYERKYADVKVSAEAESGWIFRQRQAGSAQTEVKVKSEYKTLDTYLVQSDILYKKSNKETADSYLMGVMVCYGITDDDTYAIEVKKTFNNYSEVMLTLGGSKKSVLVPNYGVNFAKNPPKKPKGHEQAPIIQEK